MEDEDDARVEDWCITACCCNACRARCGVACSGRGKTASWGYVACRPCRRSTQPGYAPGADLHGDHSHVSCLQYAGHVRPAWLSQSHRRCGKVVDRLRRQNDLYLHVARGGEVPRWQRPDVGGRESE